METIEFVANITNNEDSNLFLRALWAAFRTHFGKCAWMFTPMNLKESKTTFFGEMDIGTNDGESITVAVIYKTKGSVHTLKFSKVKPLIKTEFNSILLDTLKNYKNWTDKHIVNFSIKAAWPMARYEAPNVLITPQKNGKTNVSIRLTSYDKEDARFVFKKKYNLIAYFLYTQFWTRVSLEDVAKSKDAEANNNVFLEDLTLNINDEKSVYNGYYHLSRKALDFLNYITGTDKYSKSVERYLSAARHYKIAIDFEGKSRTALVEDIDYPEVIITSYMSSLEILSIDDTTPREQCPTCHQIKYSISQRVKDLVTQAVNRPDIIKTINMYYQTRSKFLHEGIFLSHMNYMSGTIPQVSKNDDGVEHQYYMPASLRFHVGRVFEWALNNNISFES